MKRLLSIDFGTARVGLAITDQLHIAIRPLNTLQYTKPSFWPQIINIVQTNDVGCIVLGVPYEPNEQHPLRPPLEAFEAKLQAQLTAAGLAVPIAHQDEAYSSRYAVKTMLEIGTKKKKRSTKGTIDGVAAAIILRDYMESTSGL